MTFDNSGGLLYFDSMPNIKITMSTKLYKEIKKLTAGRYISVPEFLTDIMRQHLYSDKVRTFLDRDLTPEFKREILKPWPTKT